MKCTIPEISWHNRDPVLSVDIQPIENEGFYRLATGGADCHVLIWYLKVRENGAVDVEAVSDLNRHQRAVNVVRWSPTGQYLATGCDDASIIIWSLKTDSIPLLEGETTDKETWIIHKVLRGHKEDVYDICWSPDGLKLISGSIDNTAILWDFNKGINEQILLDHKGFVQGVTWDPKGQFMATLGSDRICRIFESTGKHVKSRMYKGFLPVPDSHTLHKKELKYFHDDTFKSYFRRLNFSPDGNLLITPSGCLDTEECKTAKHATYIWTLDSLSQPSVILPSPKQITIAVRCCPVLFELHNEGNDPLIVLPYRIIIAIATDSDILLYDTQQCSPFAHFQNVHYTRITDITWSSDGRILVASSSDGFCTLVTFESNELGVPYIKEDSDLEEMDTSITEETEKLESNKHIEIEQIEAKIRKPNLLEQWAIRKPKSNKLEEQSAQNSVTKNTSDKMSLSEKPLSQTTNIDLQMKQDMKTGSNKKEIKRIVPVKIGDSMRQPEKSLQVENNMIPKNNQKMEIKHSNEGIERNASNHIIVIDDDCPEDTSLTSSLHNSAKKPEIQTKTSTLNKNSILKFFTCKNQKRNNKGGSLTNLKQTRDEVKHVANSTVEINSEEIETLNSKESDSANNQSLKNDVTNKEPATNSIVTNNTDNEGKSGKDDDDEPVVQKENMKREEIDALSNDKMETSSIAQHTEPSQNTVSNELIDSMAPKAPKIPRRIPLITLSSPKRKKL